MYEVLGSDCDLLADKEEDRLASSGDKQGNSNLSFEGQENTNIKASFNKWPPCLNRLLLILLSTAKRTRNILDKHYNIFVYRTGLSAVLKMASKVEDCRLIFSTRDTGLATATDSALGAFIVKQSRGWSIT